MRNDGPDFNPAVVDEITEAGIYICPTMNVPALALRERFGDALEKVIMGLCSGGVRIIAGIEAGIDRGWPPPGGFAGQPDVLAAPAGPSPR
ncbi:MAG TPA: hypothetical protein VHT94_17035 [Streptosporangiaceae bacterium]|nr:hypothetical protein [Streptosporangiaceae bacterium]